MKCEIKREQSQTGSSNKADVTMRPVVRMDTRAIVRVEYFFGDNAAVMIEEPNWLQVV